MKMIERFLERASKPGVMLIGTCYTSRHPRTHVLESVSEPYYDGPYVVRYVARNAVAICGRKVRDPELEDLLEKYLKDPFYLDELEEMDMKKVCRFCLKMLGVVPLPCSGIVKPLPVEKCEDCPVKKCPSSGKEVPHGRDSQNGVFGEKSREGSR